MQINVSISRIFVGLLALTGLLFGWVSAITLVYVLWPSFPK